MKKLLSVVLAAIMTVSVFALSVVPAMAATVNSPSGVPIIDNRPGLEVNGAPTSTDINYAADENNANEITFTYVGEGTLTGWEDNLESLGLAEGTDYTVTYNNDGSMTIAFLSQDAVDAWNNGQIVVNAIVDNAGPTTTEPSKKNDSSKAPATGMTALTAGGVAVACAGMAVLAATKKKDAE